MHSHSHHGFVGLRSGASPVPASRMNAMRVGRPARGRVTGVCCVHPALIEEHRYVSLRHAFGDGVDTDAQGWTRCGESWIVVRWCRQRVADVTAGRVADSAERAARPAHTHGCRSCVCNSASGSGGAADSGGSCIGPWISGAPGRTKKDDLIGKKMSPLAGKDSISPDPPVALRQNGMASPEHGIASPLGQRNPGVCSRMHEAAATVEVKLHTTC